MGMPRHACQANLFTAVWNRMPMDAPAIVPNRKITQRRPCALSAQGLRCVIFRFGTIAGASIGMRFHTAVNKFAWQACLGIPITVWRTALHQKRPYLSLRDAVRALAFVLAR